MIVKTTKKIDRMLRIARQHSMEAWQDGNGIVMIMHYSQKTGEGEIIFGEDKEKIQTVRQLYRVLGY